MNNWHTLQLSAITSELGTSLDKGLSEAEASQRIGRYGPNELVEKRERSLIRMFLEQMTEFMVLILIAASVVSFFLGETKDALFILAIVILNAILGVTQEERAGRAIRALKKMTVPKVTVKRDGELRKISVKDLVPGDVMFLESGGFVGADARVIESMNLKTDESSLTGESVPVDKTAEAIDRQDIPVADRKNMVYLGTIVSYGRGQAVVTGTGMKTEIGKIADLVQGEKETKTPLQERLDVFGKWLGIGALAVCGIVFITAVFEGGNMFDDFLTAVSLAVAAIPEGLPAVTTIALALGAYRMSKKGAIIRKLPAVETLGSVSVICTDKTGTLTQNKMSVNDLYISGRTIKVTGTGYLPSGEFTEGGRPITAGADKDLNRMLEAVALCNDAFLEYFKETDSYDVIGDPTEGALIVLAEKAGVKRNELEKKYPRTGEVPFDSKRKLMTTIHRLNGDEHIIYVKGAPDVLVKLCTGIDEMVVIRENENLTSKGLRTLGVAYKVIEGAVDLSVAEKSLTFIGLIGMIDQPRPEAKDAVRLCKAAGIEPVMVTGDHKLTAMAVAKELGIDKVYARVSPEQKLQIVEEYKKKGGIVAVTGDGVNDAPALKRADIGVAMGITGTDVAKEASDMVLADDNFATIVAAVREGRGIFENIRKFVWYLLSSNVGEIAIMFFAIVLRMPLPLLPVQILWVNLVTDGLPALALSMEPVEEDIMDRPPRKKEEGLINKDLIITMFIIGGLMAIVSLGLFSYGIKDSLAKGRTFAFSAMALLEMYNVFNCKSETKSVFKVGIFSNIYLVLAVFSTVVMQLAVIYLPVLQDLFSTVPLSGIELFWLFALSSLPLAAIEVKKLLRA